MIKRMLCAALAAAALGGCTTGGHASVMDKVKYDFGIGEAPEGYVSGSDQVFARLEKLSETEMKRMNAAGRLGEVKFAEDGLKGKWYKEVKVYEAAQPLDAQAMSRGVNTARGYWGYVEYRYELYQSERRPTQTEALALSANIPTGVKGKEVYRYKFGPAGTWDGQAGEKTTR